MSERYFVDERGGCVAVRDKTLTDPDYQGLHPDTEGVVQYWGGTRVESACPTCGYTRSFGWEVSPADVQAAHKLCDELNSQ